MRPLSDLIQVTTLDTLRTVPFLHGHGLMVQRVLNAPGAHLVLQVVSGLLNPEPAPQKTPGGASSGTSIFRMQAEPDCMRASNRRR